MEQELRNAQACAARRLDRIRALEEALERVEVTCAAISGDEPQDPSHETKFYGAHAERTPGVYTSWREARREVDGFAGSRHKKFSDYMSAAEYVNTGTESSKYDYYGVRKGRSTLRGVHLICGGQTPSGGLFQRRVERVQGDAPGP